MAEARSPIEFDSLLEHHHWMRALARTLVLDDATADDVVQQAWIAAIESPPRTEGSASGWLATVVRNLAYRTHRDRKRRQRREETVAQSESSVESGEVSVEESAERLEVQRRVIGVVLELKDIYRETILLRYYEALSSAEIARRLGVPPATVRARLKRALDELRGNLDADFGDRRSWGLALVPLANLRSSGVAASTAVAATGFSRWAALLSGPWSLVAMFLLVSGVAVGGYFALDHRRPMDGSTLAADQGPANSTATDVSSPKLEGRDDDSAAGAASDDPSGDAPDVAAPLTIADLPEGLRPKIVHTTVRGQVVGPDDQPLTNAKVFTSDDQTPVEVARDGKFVLVDPFGGFGERVFRIEAAGHAHYYRRLTLRPGREFDLGRMRLSLGGGVEGVVLDESNAPVAGANVELQRTDSLLLPSVVTTDATGRFEFSDLPIGVLEVIATTGEPARRAGSSVVIRANQVSRGIELVLQSSTVPVTCRGVVLGPDGEPYPRATVIAWSQIGSGSTTADENGEFSLPVVSGQRWTLIGRSADLRSKRRRASQRSRPTRGRSTRPTRGSATTPHLSGALVDVDPADPSLVVRLAESAFVDVRVVDADDQPVHETRVTQVRNPMIGEESRGKAAWPADVEYLDRDGAIRVFLSPDESWLEIRSVDHEEVIVGPFVPERAHAERTVVLEGLPSIRVRVSAGASVPRAKIALHTVAQSPSGSGQTTNGFPALFGLPRTTASVDHRGEATLSLNAQRLALDENASIIVRATALGFPPVWSEPLTRDAFDGQTTVDLAFVPGGSIIGRFIPPDGSDPSEWLVAASCGDGEILHVRPTRDGDYRFDNLRPGPWKVREYFAELVHQRTGRSASRAPEWSCTVKSESETRFDLDLRGRPGWTLRGTVNIDGEAPTGWSVEVTPDGGADAIDRHYYEQPTLDDAGQFTCSAFVLGPHQVVIRGVLPGGSCRMRLPVELEPGENEWRYDAAFAPISGRYRGAREGALSFRTPDSTLYFDLTVADDGTFASRVPPVSGELVWSTGFETRVLRALEVGPDGATDLVID